jgi:hypothetical protein
MTRTAAIIQDGILIYQQHDVLQTLVVGTAAWDAWLVNATSFTLASLIPGLRALVLGSSCAELRQSAGLGRAVE